MKKFLKIITLTFGFFLLAVLGYYLIIIIKARVETPRIIGQALRAENMVLKVSDLSEWQLNALLKIEDPAFYRHKGVDLRTPGAGLTTITQGLVKMYYFERFEAGLAKIKQTLIARFALDPLVAKDLQLQLFINNVYLGDVNGEPVYGFDKAARVYYGKPVNQLSQKEYLSIVAMINSPQGFHILKRPAANAERTERLMKVVSGEYRPKHLMDMYYGKLDRETQKYLAPASYFPKLYED